MYQKIRNPVKTDCKILKIFSYGSNEDIHAELSFCILTQSKALNAWKAITDLRETICFFCKKAEDMVDFLNIVRFKNNKSRYLVELREKMMDKNKK